ncbi:MAG: glutamyl-tRNA reductase [Chloroflexi bacterium]|nr:glutamyl-tRNA reductase [Chloroflexota bacterium]
MALILVGLSHQTAAVEMREQLSISGDDLTQALRHLQQDTDDVQECAIISTCNRLEIYAVGGEAARVRHTVIRFLSQYYEISAEQLEPSLYIKADTHTVNHLMRVASGLESLVLGEAQILGQVAEARAHAADAKTIGPILNRLFETVIHAGKRARYETEISRHSTSVSHVAASLIARCVTSVDDTTMLLLGAGEMAALMGQAAVDHGFRHIRIANRTFARAQALADRFASTPVEWQQMYHHIAEVDVVVAATGAPSTILHAHDLRDALVSRNGHPLLIVDIAVPRDVDSAVRDINRVTLYDIDDLQQVLDNNMDQRRASIPAVETIVAQESAHFLEWLQIRDVVPLIAQMRQQVWAIAEAEERAAMQRLQLDEREEEIVHRMVHRIVNKMLHAPTIGLRDHASQGDADKVARYVRELFALE